MKDLKLAIIGARGHLDHVLRELENLPAIRIAGATAGGDSLAPLVKWCDDRSQSLPVFQNPSEMFDKARPDAVIVAGPFELHAAMCVDAIERGIHVMTEKPAALNFADLERLRQVCRLHPGIHLAGMMFSRYSPGFYTAKSLVAAGRIGDVRLLNAQKSYRLGTRPAYYRDRESYGGTIPWVGSHAIDWIMWMSGHHFRTVYASHSIAHNGDNGTMERSALCHFNLCGGRAASLSIDFYRPATAPSHGDDWLRIVGSHGILEATPNQVLLTANDLEGVVSMPVQCNRTPLADFAEHITGGVQSIISSQETLDLTDACLRARQSADESRVVAFAQDDDISRQQPRGDTLGSSERSSHLRSAS